MGVILHNVVGLLHGAMAIYYAYIDRVPVVIFRGFGSRRLRQTASQHRLDPWSERPGQRRAGLHQVGLRAAVAGVGTGHHREGYRIASSEPAGPVYIALDAGLQEQPLDRSHPDAGLGSAQGSGTDRPDPSALRQLAEAFAKAKRPSSSPAMWAGSQRVRSTGSSGGDGRRWRPRHEHQAQLPQPPSAMRDGHERLEAADCVLFLDVKDMQKATHELDSINRKIRSKIAQDAVVLDIGFNDVGLSSWSEDYTALVETDLQVTADTTVALPMLVDICDGM